MGIPKPGLLKHTKKLAKQARERQWRIINWLASRWAEYGRDGRILDEAKMLADYYRDTGESVSLAEWRASCVIANGTYLTIVQDSSVSSGDLRKLINEGWELIENPEKQQEVLLENERIDARIWKLDKKKSDLPGQPSLFLYAEGL